MRSLLCFAAVGLPLAAFACSDSGDGAVDAGPGPALDGGSDVSVEGGLLAYDPFNHLWYSANGQQGMWRVRVQ